MSLRQAIKKGNPKAGSSSPSNDNLALTLERLISTLTRIENKLDQLKN